VDRSGRGSGFLPHNLIVRDGVHLEDHLSIIRRVVDREMARGVMPWVDRSDLEDVAQMALVEAAGKFDGCCPFAAFAYKSVRGAVLDELKALSVRNRGRDDVRAATGVGEVSEGDRWDATVYGRQNLCPVSDAPNLWEAMKALPPRQYRAVMLTYWGGNRSTKCDAPAGMTQDQVAGEMGISQQAVAKILASAKRTLREVVKGGSRSHT